MFGGLFLRHISLSSEYQQKRLVLLLKTDKKDIRKIYGLLKININIKFPALFHRNTPK